MIKKKKTNIYDRESTIIITNMIKEKTPTIYNRESTIIINMIWQVPKQKKKTPTIYDRENGRKEIERPTAWDEECSSKVPSGEWPKETVARGE